MTKIYYHATPEMWRKEKKYRFLEESGSVSGVEWKELTPDGKNNWLTEGMRDEFGSFISIGNKDAKASDKQNETVLFKTYGRGVATSRDSWTFNFSKEKLGLNINNFAQFFNSCLSKWRRADNGAKVEEYFVYDDGQISWSESLKARFASRKEIEILDDRIRQSLYRPFEEMFLYFDRSLNERVYVFPSILPSEAAEKENRVICVSGPGSNKPFQSICVRHIPSLDFLEKTQCFPFYIYNEDESNRRENITDWALEQFRDHYKDLSITKWDIFHWGTERKRRGGVRGDRARFKLRYAGVFLRTFPWVETHG